MFLRYPALGFCLVLSACAIQTGQPAGTGSRAESLVREGDVLLAESNFEGALAAYRDAIDADPEFARAYSRLAYAQLFHPGSQPEAIEQASRATELEPESGEAWAYLSRALDWNGRFEEALEAAERAADLSPQDAEVQTFLAEILADLRMYDRATAAAERAVRLDPENAEAHRNLAYVYELTGREQEALAEYLRAYDLESKFVHRHTSLAAYYLFEVDELESGRKWLVSAQELAPDDYITLIFLARVLSDRGEVEQAIAYCEQILERAPGAPDGHNCLGGVYLDAGRYTEAEAERRSAIAADPEDDTAYLGLGYVFYGQGECQQALNQFAKAVEIHPRTGGNHTALGFAHACLGQFEQAAAEYEQAIELEPQEGDHHILLGRLHLDNGDLDRAEREFEKAISLDPDNDQYVAWLGRLYAAQGDLERAVAEYERASAMDPDDVSHNLEIGFAYLDSGDDPAQAELRFEQALNTYIEQGATARQLAQAFYGLALSHLARDDCPNAIPHLQEAARLDGALSAARDYLLQCRRVAGFVGATFPPELAQRSQYSGKEALEVLRQGLAAMGIEAQAEFRPGEAGENLLVLAYTGIGQPGSADFLAQQSLVSFAGSLVAARAVVPEVGRLVVVSLNSDGEALGLLEIRAQDADLWELGVLNDAQFTAFWRALEP